MITTNLNWRIPTSKTPNQKTYSDSTLVQTDSFCQKTNTNNLPSFKGINLSKLSRYSPQAILTRRVEMAVVKEQIEHAKLLIGINKSEPGFKLLVDAIKTTKKHYGENSKKLIPQYELVVKALVNYSDETHVGDKVEILSHAINLDNHLNDLKRSK